MSVQTVTGATANEPSGIVAATQRVQQLQALIAQAQQTPFASTSVASGEGPSTTTPSSTASTASFAATLDAASGASASTGALAVRASSAYDTPIAQAAARYGLNPALLHGLIQQESGFDPSARSSAGALGLTQLMPETAASLGVANPLDPVQAIEGGARYLSQLMSQFGGNTVEALAAYNAGPGAVKQYGGVPPFAETQSYVSKVLGYANAYQQTLGTPVTRGAA